MIEYFKSEIGLIISMFVVFVSGIGIGAGITDAFGRWERKEDDNDNRQSEI